MKVSVYIATSLDGFIARSDGSLDWLPGAEGEENSDREDYGWAAFWDSVDCLVMGRKTFEKVLNLAPGAWPYEGTRVIVLSSTLTAVPDAMESKIELAAPDPAALVEMLAQEGYKHLYIDGGATIQTFLRRGLITDMTITTIPILIGEGIPLFGPLAGDVQLKLVKSQSYASGFVQSIYEI
ncbi:MAG: dihydrofolate reductase family protein [Candidatus Promineifilaceae bacterium]